MGKLTVKEIEALNAPGRHSDGDNLYLSISRSGAKSWVLFYRFGQKRREMGLGGIDQVTLAMARRRALEARQKIVQGVDPLEDRRMTEGAQASRQTFGAFADEYLEQHGGKFKSKTHLHQWDKSLTDYCAPIRGMAIGDIDDAAVLRVLNPIWKKIPETAARVRGRIEVVLDAARVKGLRSGENPARWKGHLQHLLPKRSRLTRGHHAALPYSELPTFMAELRAKDSLAALALEFCILTVTRTNETLNCVWSEIDLGKGTWIIPAARMKAGYEHRIPLSPRALDILTHVRKLRTRHSEFVFPGQKRGKPLSNMAMAQQIKRVQRADITVHGFRSTFRDWASEQTSFSNETCEHALAHRISDKAEASYRRGDQFEKRKLLMDAWQVFVDSKSCVEGDALQAEMTAIGFIRNK